MTERPNNCDLVELRDRVRGYLEGLTDAASCFVGLLDGRELAAVAAAIDRGQELLIVELLRAAMRRNADALERITSDQVAQKAAAAGGSAF